MHHDADRNIPITTVHAGKPLKHSAKLLRLDDNALCFECRYGEFFDVRFTKTPEIWYGGLS